VFKRETIATNKPFISKKLVLVLTVFDEVLGLKTLLASGNPGFYFLVGSVWLMGL